MLIRCCVADALLKNLRHLRLTFLAVESTQGKAVDVLAAIQLKRFGSKHGGQTRQHHLHMTSS